MAPIDPAAAPPLLDICRLSVRFRTAEGTVHAVDDVSYGLRAGEIVALVGESGCGKSVSALAVMGLLPRSARVGGHIMFEGRDLLALSRAEMRRLRGAKVAMVFQEPMTALNPVLSIALQLKEPLQFHLGLDDKSAEERALAALAEVGMTDPERRLGQYPHQLSGGMRQRVMIAMALACRPALIIADEPTTALDVTVQQQILDLLRGLARRLGIAVLLITHNLGIVARYADAVNVMYAGRLVEQASAAAIFARPRHFYTAALLRATPRLDLPRAARLAAVEGLPPDLRDPPAGCGFAPRCTGRIADCASRPMLTAVAPDHRSACLRANAVEITGDASPIAALGPRPSAAAPLLEADGLSRHFEIKRGFGRRQWVRAVEDVTLAIAQGETVGLVGETGCGKSSLGRLLVGLDTPSAGRVRIAGQPVAGEAFRRGVQMVFQDPMGSLNPRMTVGRFIAEPLIARRLTPSRAAARARVAELLAQVGLHPHMAERYPHELSGGQRQRAGIARALALDPPLLICDEPVSALDVSVQAQVVNLLARLSAERGLSLLFISHDLAVVRHIADRVAVMYLGRIVEIAPSDALYRQPRHPYTRALLAAVPVPDPAVERCRNGATLGGEIPSPFDPPTGCVFHTRCPIATERCRAEIPAAQAVAAAHSVACHHAGSAP